jgi:hypothetical protein
MQGFGRKIKRFFYILAWPAGFRREDGLKN